MSKKFRSKNARCRWLACGIAAATSLAMFAGACATTSSDDDDDKTNASTRVDEQVLKNGNFEFFSDGDGEYIIYSPDSWTQSTASGASSSDSQSGVIGTTAENWARLTDPDLPQAMWDNDALDSDDDDYVDYNGTPFDLPFANPGAAIIENDDDDEDDVTDDYYISDNPEDAAYIANPHTHNYRWAEENGKQVLYNAAGEKVDYTTDADSGNVYVGEELVESNVLMIHNYVEDDKQGTHSYYSSSTTLTLEANTAAKLSVWVKTSDLYFGGNNDTRTEVIDQRGAYIELSQTVGGNSLDTFKITNINTRLLNPYNEETGTWEKGNNGWMQYTIYVSACDFAETTITLTLGLGDAESNNTVEGYAFFDDATYEKYLNADAMIEAAGGETAFDGLVNDPERTTTCTLLSEPEEKIFRTDTELFNDTTEVEHYGEKQSYFVDLRSEEEHTALALDENCLTAGLTVDDNGYVSSRVDGDNDFATVGSIKPFDGTTTYLPSGLEGGINVSSDVIANIEVTSADNWSSAITGEYKTIIDDAVKTAADLPGAGDSVSTLVMLSARGAAYESVLGGSDFFTVAAEGYKIVSFWVKTSDLDTKSTVTITARQAGNESNSSSFDVDSTTVDEVTINETENVYNGWVQCYALITNSLEEEQQFELVINYGVTEIKDTTPSNYHGGWVAVTNITSIDVDETAFGYADTSARAASITINKSTGTESGFDDTYGNSNAIKTQIARPGSYNGVNGGSASVQSVPVDLTEYDKTNANQYAGLINKEYFDAYKETYAELLTQVGASSPIAAIFGTNAEWDSAVGSLTDQPLLIVNTVRKIAEESSIYNYGFIGSDATLTSSGYSVVSVRVKVSEGASANVYLVDSDNLDTLSYGTPKYTFWYDNDGNVLKGEPDKDADRGEQRANIAYHLRSDGLYEDENGKLYANLYNLERKYYDERATYYDADGNAVSFDKLADGEIYYADANGSAYAPHYLVTSSGTEVYAYVSGTDKNVVYNYFVEGEIDTEKQVHAFDTEVAVPRYTESESTPYQFTIDAVANPELAGKWITVNFFVHTGNQGKSYRLELWSGSREERESTAEDGSYVMFDYSAVTVDESSYNSLMSEYTQDIIEAYRQAIKAAAPDTVFASNEESIAYYEELAKDLNVTVDLYDYYAQYYTYTLYDSATYVPFNEDVAEEDETGYNYAYGDFEESTAVLKVNDTDRNGAPMMNMFIDYSAVDQNITITSASDVDDDEEEETTTPTDATNAWLLASSIALVVAMVAAIAVLLIKDLAKKLKRRPKVAKNTYNYTKNKRYVRTYVKEHGETKPAESEQPAENTGEPVENEQPAESADEPVENEQPAENTGEPVENEQPAESADEPVENEQPAESADEPAESEQPAESADEPAEVNKEDGEKSDN